MEENGKIVIFAKQLLKITSFATKKSRLLKKIFIKIEYFIIHQIQSRSKQDREGYFYAFLCGEAECGKRRR
jgi:hypothetical protein